MCGFLMIIKISDSVETCSIKTKAKSVTYIRMPPSNLSKVDFYKLCENYKALFLDERKIKYYNLKKIK